eukprot:5830312-Amphidinium_carterae.1
MSSCASPCWLCYETTLQLSWLYGVSSTTEELRGHDCLLKRRMLHKQGVSRDDKAPEHGADGIMRDRAQSPNVLAFHRNTNLQGSSRSSAS